MKKFTLLALTVFALSGCQTATQPTNSAGVVKKPSETMMCTMQYDPVCGKVEHNGVFSYKTYGNACTATNSKDNVVSYTQGGCGAIK